MEYKILGEFAVLRISDMASIPFDPDNTDYQEYLRFLAEGGQPLPADDDGQTAE
jgi:hypothetical protein